MHVSSCIMRLGNLEDSFFFPPPKASKNKKKKKNPQWSVWGNALLKCLIGQLKLKLYKVPSRKRTQPSPPTSLPLLSIATARMYRGPDIFLLAELQLVQQPTAPLKQTCRKTRTLRGWDLVTLGGITGGDKSSSARVNFSFGGAPISYAPTQSR